MFERGNSLIPVAALMAAGAVGITLAAGGATPVRDQRMATVAAQRQLAELEMALVAYVARNRRMPCPADGSLAPGAPGAGRALPVGSDGRCRFGAGKSADWGVVPWAELGLTMDAVLDPWDNRIGYVAWQGREIGVVEESLDFSRCYAVQVTEEGLVSNGFILRTVGNVTGAVDQIVRGVGGTVGGVAGGLLGALTGSGGASGGGQLPGWEQVGPPADPLAPDPCQRNERNPLTLLAENGMQVSGRQTMDRDAGGGAAFVLVSAGPNGAGAFAASGTRRAAQRSPREVAPAADNMTINPFSGVTGAQANDDLVRAISVFDLINRAGLAPRFDSGCIGDAYLCRVKALGAIALYRLDETGGTAARDVIGWQTGRYVNMQPNGSAQGPLDGIVTVTTPFTAAGAHVRVDRGANFRLTAGSVHFWFKPDTTNGRQTLVSRDLPGLGAGQLSVVLDNRSVVATLEQGATQEPLFPAQAHTIASGSVITRGIWYHGAVTWGPTGFKLYVNGNLIGERAYSGGTEGNSLPLLIGANVGALGEPIDTYRGNIVEVALHNRALTIAQLREIVDEGPGGGGPPQTCQTHPQLVQCLGVAAYWRLDETVTSGDGGTAVDSVGGYDGTYRGGVALAVTPSPQRHSAARTPRFSGGAQFVNVPGNGNFGTTQGTVQVWFRTETTSGTQGLYCRDGAGTVAGDMCFVVSGNGLSLLVDRSGTTETLNAANLVTAGAWTQGVVSWGPAGLTLYANGRRVANRATSTQGMNPEALPIVIGAGSRVATRTGLPTGLDSLFRGNLSDAAFWPRQLTDDEVLRLYNAAQFSERPRTVFLDFTDVPSTRTDTSIIFDGVTVTSTIGGAAGPAGNLRYLVRQRDHGLGATGNVNENCSNLSNCEIDDNMGGTAHRGNILGQEFVTLQFDQPVTIGEVTVGRSSGPLDSFSVYIDGREVDVRALFGTDSLRTIAANQGYVCDDTRGEANSRCNVDLTRLGPGTIFSFSDGHTQRPGDDYTLVHMKVTRLLENRAGCTSTIALAGTTGSQLAPGFCLVSPDGNYTSVWGADGNLTVRLTRNLPTGAAAWRAMASVPAGDGIPVFLFQATGALEILRGPTTLWTSGAYGAVGPHFLALHEDGNLATYRGTNTSDLTNWTWSWMTGRR